VHAEGWLRVQTLGLHCKRLSTSRTASGNLKLSLHRNNCIVTVRPVMTTTRLLDVFRRSMLRCWLSIANWTVAVYGAER